MATPLAARVPALAPRVLPRRRRANVARVTADDRVSDASPSGRADEDEVSSLKRELLAAVSASRKPGADPRSSKRAILDAVVALEARGAPGDVPFADVSGRWSLVYSTNDDKGSAALGPLADLLDDSALQRVTDQLYRTFFAFAPALAGSAETNARGVANVQVVDLAAGKVDNVVDVDLPWPLESARVRVRGDVSALDGEAREVTVTFTEWEFGPGPAGSRGGAGSEPPSLRLPLPRPRGCFGTRSATKQCVYRAEGEEASSSRPDSPTREGETKDGG